MLLTKRVEGLTQEAENCAILPSFCNFEYAPSYLDDIYNKIESGNYPTVGALKSNKVDSFFEILNWHPYNMFDTEINDYWQCKFIR